MLFRSNIESRHLPSALQRQQLDLVQTLNRNLLARQEVNADVEGVIESYELAFRMQGALPDVLDLKDETQATLDLYGINGDSDQFGRQCLMARRLAESGVRFIEITHGNWDQHKNLKSALSGNAKAIDRPLSGLLTDLDRRGLLKDTLVIWGGEFGRTPHVKAKDEIGRAHV